MDKTKVKPIPKYIEKKIRALDLKKCPQQSGLRFYSYLTKMGGELVKVTVAMRNKNKKEALVKQVAIHGVKSNKCLVRDLEYCYLGIYAYRVGWYDEGIHYPGGRPFYNDGVWYEVEWKYYNPFTKVINLEYALKQKEYKYSAIDIFDPDCPIKYLKLYEQFPQMEYLVKLGYKNLAMSKMILRKAGKDMKFAKWLAKNRYILGGYPRYYVDVVIRAYTKGTSLDTEQARAELIKRHKNGDYRAFMNRFGNDTDKFFDYIVTQNTNIYSYIDYYNACEYLNIDMSDTKNRYPKDFRRWHNIRIDEYRTAKALKDEEKRKTMYNQFADIANKFLPLERNRGEGYVVIIAKSPAELVEEGKVLSHCVGSMNYDQKFIREESLIFFVRPISDIHTPYVTMEYSISKKKILQCYGEHDHRPAQEVLDYVNKKWLPYANRKIKALVAA